MRVSLAPIQSYKMKIVEYRDEDGEVIVDTTQFYHTRMVGWYPKNCRLPERNGVPADAQFDALSEFEAVRLNETVKINNVDTEIVGIHFKNFNGETDIMVSNVCEGQPWHKYNATTPHLSDVHPVDKSNIYQVPFGHNFISPVYQNFFTFKHYRSAVRISAYADQSAQSLSMWGEIQDVIIRNQPTSCKIWLPTELGQFGQVYEWGDYKNQHIVRTAMFGDDSNHPEYHEEAKYPISMEGSSLQNNTYLGYSLIEPGRDLELELHTASGVYTTTINARHVHEDAEGNETVFSLFEAGNIYHITLDLQTTGTIAAILEREGEERYYDLSLLHEYEVGPENQTDSIGVFKIANCYIIDPTQDSKVKDAQGNVLKDENNNDLIYDGFCFLGTVVGNGQAGIISSGSQQLYPTSEKISPVSAHLLWESQLGLITNVELKFGYVRFKVPKNENIRGNAVIAVYDEKDRVLWSWHIWITESPEEVEIQLNEGEHHTIKMLDRNLGATAATCTSDADALATYGLYYQWGRKDPSMGPEKYDYKQANLICAPYYDYSSDEKTAAAVAQFPRPTLKDAVENPMYLILPTEQTNNYSFNWLYDRYDFLWGFNEATGMTTKTIYDPCPYGYRVPSSELNHIFTSESGKGERGTYGYTITFGSKSIFFPYAGYKGVDVGLTSVSLPWKYVGNKGDYQSSMYCNDNENGTSLDIPYWMHRERIYISYEQSWEETNVGNYNEYMTPCYANRRTAASVRCVKDQQIGSINGSINIASGSLEADTQVLIAYNAHSYGSAIHSAVIQAEYRTTDNTEQVVTLKTDNRTGEYILEGTAGFYVPNNCDENGVIFRLIVQNEHGLTYSDVAYLVNANVTATFLQWNVLGNENINNTTPGYAITGQTIRYYVGVLANVEPSSVTINNIAAKEINDYTSIPQPEGTATSKTVWYVDMSWDEANKLGHEVTVSIVADNKTFEYPLTPVQVVGYKLTEVITLVTDGSKQYVMKNTNYSSYLTTSGTNNVAANDTLNEYSYVTIVAGNNNTYRIKSVANNTYFNRNNNNSVSLNNNGTNFTFSEQDDGSYKISVRSGYRTYYLRQTSATAVEMSTTDSNNNWRFYESALDLP